ncbi:MAG: carbohydrate kinase family protein [Lachnospiraceae bacterium]|nr:carbohydrate kinase family protein [Lachnospiraceae bacterium]
MKYVIASTAVTDEIRFADGKHVEKVAGGAGIYALCGVKLWDDDVTLATGVGEDYGAIYGEWYEKNGLSMAGLIPKDAKTPHTVIQYFADGEREEMPLYGADHYKKVEITPEELWPYFDKSTGIYIFKNSNKEFWDKVLDMKKESTAKVMWEIANDATYYENLSEVKRIARRMDILSINLTEAKSLLGMEETDAIVAAFQTWQTPLVFLRRGSKGSIMITAEQVVEVPSEQGVHVVDPTGGGNSSSGAVLCGYCEGRDLATCARMGNLSAVMCLGQYGVPEVIDRQMQTKAREKLQEETTC